MNQMLIFTLVFLTVVCIGSALLLIVRSRTRVASRLLETEAGSSVAEQRGAMIDTVRRLGHAFTTGRGSSTLRNRLTSAGYYGEGAVGAYLGIKVVLLVTGAGLAAISALPLSVALLGKVYAIVITAGLMFFLPNIVLRARLSKRRREVRRHLPDVIDLLEVCVSAGMGLDQAWNAVGDEIRHVSPILSDEMALTNLEIQLGTSRADALRHMSDRTGADECSSLVALLVQSDRFGTSVSEALGTFASSMREARSQHAEETAEKMAVKLLFPLVFFIFPVMLIVMVGPTAITLVKVLGGS